METAGKQPDCFGVMWDMSAPECAGCYIRKECERSTGRRESGESVAEEPVSAADSQPAGTEEQEPISPLKHLLKSLEGKYDRSDRVGKQAVGYFFVKDGKTMVLVTESNATGRVKIEAKDYERIFDSIESVEQAEEVLAALS